MDLMERLGLMGLLVPKENEGLKEKLVQPVKQAFRENKVLKVIVEKRDQRETLVFKAFKVFREI